MERKEPQSFPTTIPCLRWLWQNIKVVVSLWIIMEAKHLGSIMPRD
jgi:hypothetical protein